MRVLITGHRGFIGRALFWEMANAGHTVAGMDHTQGSRYDVRDPKNVHRALENGEPDVVVHLAAEVGKLNCESFPSRAIDTNVGGTLRVAKACAYEGVPLVYVSTSEVYGDYGNTLIDESCVLLDGPETSGVYALTKRWGEDICLTYALEGLKIIRPTMPYGPGVPPGPGRRALDNLIWQALTGQPMIVHRGAARSWCWIDDLVSGMRAVIERGAPGTYNVGRDDDDVSMEDLALAIRTVVWQSGYDGDQSRIEVVEPPARQTAVKRISCAKLEALGWKPETSLDEGLPKMVDWIRRWMSAQAASSGNSR
jgi:nucleoside-diphosphate-sugar epimerase